MEEIKKNRLQVINTINCKVESAEQKKLIIDSAVYTSKNIQENEEAFSFEKIIHQLNTTETIPSLNLFMKILATITGEKYTNTVLEKTKIQLIEIIQNNIINGIYQIRDTLKNKLGRMPHTEETLLRLMPIYITLKKENNDRDNLVLSILKKQILQFLKDATSETPPEYSMIPEVFITYQEEIIDLINEEIQKNNNVINFKKIEAIILSFKNKTIDEIKTKKIKQYTEQYKPFFEINSSIEENTNVRNTPLTFFESIENHIQLKTLHNEEIISLIKETTDIFKKKSFFEFCQHYQKYKEDILQNSIPSIYTVQMEEVKKLSFIYLYLFYFFKYFEKYYYAEDHAYDIFGGILNGLTVITKQENISEEKSENLDGIMQSILFYNNKKFSKDPNYNHLFNKIIESDNIKNLIKTAINKTNIDSRDYSDLLNLAQYRYFTSLLPIKESKILVNKITLCLQTLIEEEKLKASNNLEIKKKKYGDISRLINSINKPIKAQIFDTFKKKYQVIKNQETAINKIMTIIKKIDNELKNLSLITFKNYLHSNKKNKWIELQKDNFNKKIIRQTEKISIKRRARCIKNLAKIFMNFVIAEKKKILADSLRLIKEGMIKNIKKKSIETMIHFFKEKYLLEAVKNIKKYSKIKSLMNIQLRSTVISKKLFLQILKTKIKQNTIEKKLSINYKYSFFDRWKDKRYAKNNAATTIFTVTNGIDSQNKGYFLKLANEESQKKLATQTLLSLNFW